jgi:predicted DCC family thiol-disulfide oxidoreductase YuxK
LPNSEFKLEPDGIETVSASKRTELQTSSSPGHELILYDGVCGLCNRFIKIVLDNDPQGHFQFASLQSDIATRLLHRLGKDPAVLKSIYLIKGYEQSDSLETVPTAELRMLSKARAALAICAQLDGPIHLVKYFSLLPTWLLDFGYDLVAANRYRIFGRHDTCPLPNPAHFARFIDQSGA